MAIPSLAGARVGNNSGRYIPAGEHVFDIKCCKIVKSFAGELFFVAEMDLVESDNPTMAAGEYSFVKPFVDKFGYGPNDIKGFLCTVIEKLVPNSKPSTEWQDAYIAWAASEGDDPTHAQPFRGVRLHASAWDKPNKKSAGTTTVIDWVVMEGGATLGLQPQARAPAPAPVATSPFPSVAQASVPKPAPATAPWMPQGSTAAPAAPPGWSGPWPPTT